MRAVSSCEWELGWGVTLLFVAVHWLLTAVASRVVEHRGEGTQASVVVAHGLNICSCWALEQQAQ